MSNQPSLGVAALLLISFSSVVGSGLFFLPALVGVASPNNPLLPWLLVALVCLPFLYVFYTLTMRFPHGQGVISAIEATLGEKAAIFGTVVTLFSTFFGMPLAALVASDFLVFLITEVEIRLPFAAILLAAAVAQSAFGFNVGTRVQAALILFASTVLVVFLFNQRGVIEATDLQWDQLSLLQGVAASSLVFWAFSGWENLTFFAHRLKNPAFSLAFAMIGTLVLACVVYGAFSAIAKAAMSDEGSSENLLEVFQLSSTVVYGISLTFLLGGCAVAVIWANLSAWVLGLSEMAAARFCIPRGKVHFVLAGGYAAGLSAVVWLPVSVDSIVRGVSAGFLTVYLLVAIAFFRISQRLWAWFAAGIVALVTTYLAVHLEGLILPIIALLLCLLFRWPGRKREES